jgi:hypothetical protein
MGRLSDVSEFEDIIVKFKIDDGKVTGLAFTQGQSTTQLSRVTETKQP